MRLYLKALKYFGLTASLTVVVLPHACSIFISCLKSLQTAMIRDPGVSHSYQRVLLPEYYFFYTVQHMTVMFLMLPRDTWLSAMLFNASLGD